MTWSFLQMEEEHPLYNLIFIKLDVYIPIIEVPNILFLISHHSIFRFEAD
jgi:hypothetical protein